MGGRHHLITRCAGTSTSRFFVHDNQIYGLTKDRPPPRARGYGNQDTALRGARRALNPIALGVALDCSFVGRAYAGEGDHLIEMMKQAITHKGFALLDILQPCVTYNKVNTYEWFKHASITSTHHTTLPTGSQPCQGLEFGHTFPSV